MKKCTNFPFGRRLHVRGHVWRRGRFPVGESRRLIPQTECVGDPETVGELKVLFPHVWMFVNRGAQRDPPAGREAQRACVPFRWATAGRRGLGPSRRASWRRLWLSPAPPTAARSRQQPPARWESQSVTDARPGIIFCCHVCHIAATLFFFFFPLGLGFRETPPAMWLRCLQGPQSVMISSARPCSKRCKPPTCPLCRWGRRLNPAHSIHRGTSNLLLCRI